jgi:hypothetical protein
MPASRRRQPSEVSHASRDHVQTVEAGRANGPDTHDRRGHLAQRCLHEMQSVRADRDGLGKLATSSLRDFVRGVVGTAEHWIIGANP